MGANEDNPGGGGAQSGRRTGTEAAGSYAYHESRAERVERVEKVRPQRAPAPANDTTPVAHPRAAKATIVGGFAAPLVTPSIASGRSLSEPPDIGSWPPMPNVPGDLPRGASERPTAEVANVDDDDFESLPTDPPERQSSAGAIWDAMPTVVGTSDERVDESTEPFAAESPKQESDSPPELEPERPSLAMTPDKLSPIHLHADASALSGAGYREANVARLETLIERGAWEEVAKELEDVAAPSPTLRLLRVIAQREVLPAEDKRTGQLMGDALGAIADLVGVPATSPAALMLTKRLLRRNPVWTQNQPKTGVSVGIVIAGLAVGLAIGWAVTNYFL